MEPPEYVRVEHTVEGLSKAMEAYDREFSQGDRELSMLSDFITKTITNSVSADRKRFHNKLLQIHPLFESFRVKLSTLSQFVKPWLATKYPDGHVAYLNTMLVYAWMVEGVFDEAIRLLYVLINLAKGKDIQYEQIQESDIKCLREDLRSLVGSQCNILFAGYEDGRLRNAIFHFRFEYDESKGEMHFQDRPSKKWGTYDRTFTFDGFQRVYRLLEAVINLILDNFMMLRVIDLVYSKDPFFKQRNSA